MNKVDGTTNMVIIGLGSNIEPEQNIAEARKILADQFDVFKESDFIRTKPVGYTEQDDFINGAVLLKTKLAQQELTATLKTIEKDLGRQVSKIKSGPRTIDLDIVTFNGEIIDQDFYTRDFLKNSVLELIPNLDH